MTCVAWHWKCCHCQKAFQTFGLIEFNRFINFLTTKIISKTLTSFLTFYPDMGMVKYFCWQMDFLPYLDFFLYQSNYKRQFGLWIFCSKLKNPEVISIYHASHENCQLVILHTYSRWYVMYIKLIVTFYML